MALRTSVDPLPLVRRDNGGRRRPLALTVILESDEPAPSSAARIIGFEKPIDVDLGPLTRGANQRTLFVPADQELRSLQVDVSCGLDSAQCQILLTPVRMWTVYLALHSHTDLGFTHPLSEVVRIHNENTDRALELCQETADWEDGERFAWTCEVMWQVQNFLRDRSAAHVEGLMRLAREERMEFGALYAGEHTDLLGHEEAVRSLAFAGHLRQRYHVPVETVLLSDVPGCTAGFVQVMAKSGIRNFLLADNNFIAPFLARTTLPRPFFWEGADDTSVLAWFTDHPYYAYVEGELYGFNDTPREVETRLGSKLATLEAAGCPYSSLLVQYAFDNARLNEKPLQIVREWNRIWEWPRIRIATPREFFRAIRREGGEAIPRHKGDWTNWWSSIVTGFPIEAALSRRLHDKLPAVEGLLALLHLHGSWPDYPGALVNSCYDRLLAFDEHSGGGGVWKPRSKEEQQQALREGYDLLHSASRDIEEMQQRATEAARAQGILQRSAPATPEQAQRPRSSAGQPAEDGFRILESQYYRIEIESERKRVVSVWDKQLQRELANPLRSDWGFPLMYHVTPVKQIELGKYIPEIYMGVSAPGEVTDLRTLSDITYESVAESEDEAACVFCYAISGVEWLTRRLILERNKPVIRIEHTFKRVALDAPPVRKVLGGLHSQNAALYVVLDFACDRPEIRYESPNMVLDPVRDPMPGSCRDFAAIQHWVLLSDAHVQMAVSAPDTPIVDIGSPGFQVYRSQCDNDRSALFFRVGSLDEWGTDRGSPFTRNDDLQCTFAITTFPPPLSGGLNLEGAMRFGWEEADRSASRELYACEGTSLSSAVWGCVKGLPTHVRVLAFKRAEDTSCYILRMQEMIGAAAEARISIAECTILSACSAMLTEEPLEPLRVEENSIAVSFAPFAMVTLRLVLELYRIPVQR